MGFGALLEFANERAASEYARVAGHTGLLCAKNDNTTVRICNSPMFGACCDRHGVPKVACEEHASLCAAVISGRQWMLSERGEGQVMSVARGGGKVSSYKWKISREPQPAAVDALTELVATLTSGTNGKGRLLDNEIHEMIHTLLAVSTHVDSTTVQAKGDTKAKKQPKQAIVDPAAMERAIASALTKFDAIDAYLDANGQAGVTPLVERLVAEVNSDAELSLPPEGTAAHEIARKEVATAVKRCVGQHVGVWKKAKAVAAGA